MVRNITDGLIEVDPANRTFYEQNHDDYLEELGQLDTDIRGGLEGVQNRTFMTYHASFGYFAAEYGLTQLPIEAEGKEPTASGLLELIDEARSLGIKVIFIEPQFNPQSAEVIANEIGGSVIAIDPLARDYLENMRDMADKFIETLNNQ
jgi:zinc transport system substrate-binding protein